MIIPLLKTAGCTNCLKLRLGRDNAIGFCKMSSEKSSGFFVDRQNKKVPNHVKLSLNSNY